uniref:Uncharacterized protein n=1 Tax=Setaria viridis TaxID=4556 RepID=A0A4U6TAB3_SETVI|nr:hypothetical protein SEVIR_9G267700v2 [Setaria viridis]
MGKADTRSDPRWCADVMSSSLPPQSCRLVAASAPRHCGHLAPSPPPPASAAPACALPLRHPSRRRPPPRPPYGLLPQSPPPIPASIGVGNIIAGDGSGSNLPISYTDEEGTQADMFLNISGYGNDEPEPQQNLAVAEGSGDGNDEPEP